MGSSVGSSAWGLVVLGCLTALFWFLVSWSRKSDGPRILSSEVPLAIDTFHDGVADVEKRYYSGRRGLELRYFRGTCSYRKFTWWTRGGQACEMTDTMVE